MNRQDQLLENEDGRYYAIDKFRTGLAAIATAERIEKRVISFGLPSGPALFLHIAHQAYSRIRGIAPLSLFDQHEQGIWPDNQGPLFDFMEDFISHIVFAFTSIEAFANETIPADYIYSFKVDRTGEERTYNKDEIERGVNLDEKLHIILPTICSVPSPKGTRVWENYRQIKKTRDRIIHLKSVDRKASGPEEETIWGTMLRLHEVPFCDYAHEIIGHFGSAVDSRRWYMKYPYDHAVNPAST